MVKVVVVAEGNENEVGDYDDIASVEIHGATGGSTYRLDRSQDFLIKIVVNGNVKADDDEDNRSLDPRDHPVPQIQTGDAGDSNKAKDVDGNPVYPDPEKVARERERAQKDREKDERDARDQDSNQKELESANQARTTPRK